MNNPPITIDRHSAKVIAAMLKGYVFLLSVPPQQDDAIECLLDDEAGQATQLRNMLLQKIKETA